MNNKFFFYWLAVTIVTTAVCWGSLFDSASGSSWRSYGGYVGGHSRGGHK